MPENMNSGKTHAFFTWAADYASVPDVEYVLDDSEMLEHGEFLDDPRVKAVTKGERKPDYVVKADDDSFIMLGELERRLRVAPRSKAYWGCESPQSSARVNYDADDQTWSRTRSWPVKRTVFQWTWSTTLRPRPVSVQSPVERRTSSCPSGCGCTLKPPRSPG